jgi:predicted  nucleic acid-binding Zn-ribbon protein
MSWEAVAAISALITVTLVIAGIVFASGRMVASVEQVRNELARLGKEVTGLRHDLKEQRTASESLEDRVGDLQQQVAAIDLRLQHIESLMGPGTTAKKRTTRRRA